jgi:ribosome-binding protein aMBF1 (putative translation factor)
MKTIPSPDAFSMHTKGFEHVSGQAGVATSRTRCQIFACEDYAAPRPQAPPRHTPISQLVAEWEEDTAGRAALEEGRRWVAANFYAQDGDTLRTLRLRHGWSQGRLAAAMATSQSHVARIERGTENLTIATCRKLASVFGIDLNTLDDIHRRQEAMAQAKQ